MFNPQIVVVDGEEFYALREFRCGDRKFYCFGATPETEERARSIMQRQAVQEQSPDWGNDLLVFGTDIAELLACFLTPEGVRPDKKDIDAIQKEILGLPFEFVCAVFTEARALAMGKIDVVQ